MKHYLTALLLMTSGLLAGAQTSTNLLAIYLVDTPLFHPWPAYGAGKLENLKLISPPVFADQDFVSFDTTNQTFAVKADAARRLARSTWNLGKKDSDWGAAPTIYRGGVYDLIPAPAPFVLMASGKPVYEGAFFTLSSSSSFPGPVILSDVLFISTNLTQNVSFRIELGYPGTFPGVADPRDDARINSAVHELFAGQKK